jgi:tetratricopeptide (TPR) repeat protein
LLVAFPFSFAFGNTEIYLNADKQFSYAEKCFSDEEYQNAADEYKKFVFFFPDDERVEIARYKTCLSLYRSGRYRETIKSCRSFEDQADDTEISQKASFLISRSYLELGMNGPAVISLNNLLMRTKDIAVKDLAKYELGWISLEYPSYTEEYSANIKKAHTYFGRISPHGIKEFKIEELSCELDNYQAIAKKNPLIAGGLSIVPGAGQLYCERYQDSLVAFLLNAGLGIAAYESFDNKNYALGGLISFVGLGFYAGNIYGAVSSAHKYNKELNRNFIKELKSKIKINISDWIEGEKVSVLYQHNF